MSWLERVYSTPQADVASSHLDIFSSSTGADALLTSGAGGDSYLRDSLGTMSRLQPYYPLPPMPPASSMPSQPSAGPSLTTTVAHLSPQAPLSRPASSAGAAGGISGGGSRLSHAPPSPLVAGASPIQPATPDPHLNPQLQQPLHLPIFTTAGSTSSRGGGQLLHGTSPHSPPQPPQLPSVSPLPNGLGSGLPPHPGLGPNRSSSERRIQRLLSKIDSVCSNQSGRSGSGDSAADSWPNNGSGGPEQGREWEWERRLGRNTSAASRQTTDEELQVLLLQLPPEPLHPPAQSSFPSKRTEGNGASSGSEDGGGGGGRVARGSGRHGRPPQPPPPPPRTTIATAGSAAAAAACGDGDAVLTVARGRSSSSGGSSAVVLDSSSWSSTDWDRAIVQADTAMAVLTEAMVRHEQEFTQRVLTGGDGGGDAPADSAAAPAADGEEVAAAGHVDGDNSADGSGGGGGDDMQAVQQDDDVGGSSGGSGMLEGPDGDDDDSLSDGAGRELSARQLVMLQQQQLQQQQAECEGWVRQQAAADAVPAPQAEPALSPHDAAAAATAEPASLATGGSSGEVGLPTPEAVVTSLHSSSPSEGGSAGDSEGDCVENGVEGNDGDGSEVHMEACPGQPTQPQALDPPEEVTEVAEAALGGDAPETTSQRQEVEGVVRQPTVAAAAPPVRPISPPPPSPAWTPSPPSAQTLASAFAVAAAAAAAAAAVTAPAARQRSRGSKTLRKDSRATETYNGAPPPAVQRRRRQVPDDGASCSDSSEDSSSSNEAERDAQARHYYKSAAPAPVSSLPPPLPPPPLMPDIAAVAELVATAGAALAAANELTSRLHAPVLASTPSTLSRLAIANSHLHHTQSHNLTQAQAPSSAAFLQQQSRKLSTQISNASSASVSSPFRARSEAGLLGGNGASGAGGTAALRQLSRGSSSSTGGGGGGSSCARAAATAAAPYNVTSHLHRIAMSADYSPRMDDTRRNVLRSQSQSRTTYGGATAAPPPPPSSPWLSAPPSSSSADAALENAAALVALIDEDLSRCGSVGGAGGSGASSGGAVIAAAAAGLSRQRSSGSMQLPTPQRSYTPYIPPPQQTLPQHAPHHALLQHQPPYSHLHSHSMQPQFGGHQGQPPQPSLLQSYASTRQRAATGGTRTVGGAVSAGAVDGADGAVRSSDDGSSDADVSSQGSRRLSTPGRYHTPVGSSRQLLNRHSLHMSHVLKEEQEAVLAEASSGSDDDEYGTGGGAAAAAGKGFVGIRRRLDEQMAEVEGTGWSTATTTSTPPPARTSGGRVADAAVVKEEPLRWATRTSSSKTCGGGGGSIGGGGGGVRGASGGPLSTGGAAASHAAAAAAALTRHTSVGGSAKQATQGGQAPTKSFRQMSARTAAAPYGELAASPRFFASPSSSATYTGWSQHHQGVSGGGDGSMNIELLKRDLERLLSAR